MGSIISTNKPRQIQVSSQRSNFSVRSGSRVTYSGVEEQHLEEERSQWKMLPSVEEAKEKFQNDGSLTGKIDAGHLELRILLDEPLGQQSIGEFAKSIHTSESFMCWIDLLEFKSIPTDALQYRHSKAIHIFQKYIRPGAISEFGGILDVDRDKYKEALNENKPLTSDFFEKLQTQCFEDIYENTFKRFQSTTTYMDLKKSFKKKYNRVQVDDFWYYEKLGEGGFGFVVHCQKKTTKTHYAMKIQTKTSLIESFADDSTRIDFEKAAYASCQHPFIINLDYAFQTDQLVFMALALCTCGDLQQALNISLHNRLSEERTKFYIAEVVVALGHLHSLGLMYRDLKPNNVLLDYDGHIKLADLGGVVDQEGKTLGRKSELVHPLFSTKFGPHEDNDDQKRPGQIKRRMSVMGTFGYMAPEMVIMLNQSSAERRGYTNAVDWWSLGITTFKLLTGYKPFEKKSNAGATEEDSLFPAPKKEFPEYSMLFEDIVFPRYVSTTAADFIRNLLNVSETNRLGYGVDGLENVKSHAFFDDIDFQKLVTKHQEPPFLPDLNVINEVPMYESFNQMMEELGKSSWLTKNCSPSQQRYFETWDFVSAHTLRVEFGLANEMDQLDRNYKVRQLMGAGANREPSGILVSQFERTGK
mmetsp:Transcript_7589/g.8035  ORF Transcript_7589/g.8035 Transcript_7589/m.8035 type:complete len:642 (-) Transcript_7589:200-2125(-)